MNTIPHLIQFYTETYLDHHFYDIDGHVSEARIKNKHSVNLQFMFLFFALEKPSSP